jgi:hypothetical protein|tara:strand:+ start:197 stop:310 length:114 start_codon:yes stop_codon:yes gene_type:complete
VNLEIENNKIGRKQSSDGWGSAIDLPKTAQENAEGEV